MSFSSTELQEIETKIYLIRGRKVMLDADLATLYQIETKNLNKGVQRNKIRFPEDFMFQLTPEEYVNLRFQIGTSSSQAANINKELGHGGRRTPPYVFTQEGVAMLSGVLQSDRAVQVNLAIMRTFVKLRVIITSNQGLTQQLSELERKYDRQFKSVFDAIRALMSERIVPAKRIIGLNRPNG